MVKTTMMTIMMMVQFHSIIIDQDIPRLKYKREHLSVTDLMDQVPVIHPLKLRHQEMDFLTESIPKIQVV